MGSCVAAMTYAVVACSTSPAWCDAYARYSRLSSDKLTPAASASSSCFARLRSVLFAPSSIAPLFQMWRYRMPAAVSLRRAKSVLRSTIPGLRMAFSSTSFASCGLSTSSTGRARRAIDSIARLLVRFRRDSATIASRCRIIVSREHLVHAADPEEVREDGFLAVLRLVGRKLRDAAAQRRLRGRQRLRVVECHCGSRQACQRARIAGTPRNLGLECGER